MKTNLKKALVSAVTLLCMMALSVTAFAGEVGYYASDEGRNKTPPDAISSITITSEDVNPGTDGGNATTEIEGEVVDLDSFFSDLFDIFGSTDILTPAGNLTLIDSILQNENNTSIEFMENEQKSKQFITVQTKNGNYFYIIIDRSGDTENVYFLNMVDETDLFSLLEDSETDEFPAVCSCTDKCVAGAVNITCEICMVNMSECLGKEPEPVKPDEPEKPVEEKKGGASAIVAVVLILAAGGGAFYFLVLKPMQEKKVNYDPDYFDLEDDEYLSEDQDTD